VENFEKFGRVMGRGLRRVGELFWSFKLGGECQELRVVTSALLRLQFNPCHRVPYAIKPIAP